MGMSFGRAALGYGTLGSSELANSISGGKLFGKGRKFFGFGEGGSSEKKSAFDLSAELASLRAMFDELRANETSKSKSLLGDINSLSASNLAGREILSSPVSENTFSRNSKNVLADLNDRLASITGQEAGIRSQFLRDSFARNDSRDEADRVRALKTRQMLLNLLVGGGASLLSGSPAPLAAAGGKELFSFGGGMESA